MISELWRDVVEGESVEATEAVAKIVGCVLAGGAPLARPGGRPLAEARRYVRMPRGEFTPRAAALLLVEREATLKTGG